MATYTKIEVWVENLIWGSRRAMFLAVVVCMIAFFSVLFLTVIDLFHVVVPVLSRLVHLNFAADASSLHAETLKNVVGLVNNFLIAIFLLLFAYGMYELFVSELEPPAEEKNSHGDRIVFGSSIKNLDDFNRNLVKMLTVILLVRLFEEASGVELQTATDLVCFAAAILFVALTLYTTNLAGTRRSVRDRAGPD